MSYISQIANMQLYFMYAVKSTYNSANIFTKQDQA